ncbi:hypothetical protein B0T17DRAFT_591822 [Bombardia bombarda]|uniref:Abscission/NoCut checkpoint regulator n=1 Tax=Bombardia bombarda TaxID=252184 RepID=A0AA39WM34_9PEZI|nr:hypothetical protein B0T17DRAFT_591822 [Bombardia bombarda]
MATPRPDDRSLLDRLNALKPTTVTLDKDANLQDAQESSPPLSREDALAARLRILRDGGVQKKKPQPEPAQAGSRSSPPLPTPTPPIARPPAEPRISKSQTPRNNAYYDIPPWEADLVGEDDQAALDELLEGLSFEVPEADTATGTTTAAAPLSEFDPAHEAHRVSALLEKLQKSPTDSVDHAAGEGAPPHDTSEDDDSDGEHMTREVEEILSRARDEIALSESDPDRGPRENVEKDTGAADTNAAVAAVTPPAEPSGNIHKPDSTENPILSLPEVPSSPPTYPDPSIDNNTQETPEQRRRSLDFENDITTRMASLKGLGSGINVDSFGLPSAPTFQPSDHLPPLKGLGTAAGYTDEDQKTWCIVCLEDAAIRCVGCDNDVYCARCWKDMHLGPSAGFDERGHKWVKFERDLR